MSFRVFARDGWVSGLLPIGEAESLAKEHPGSRVVFEKPKHPRITQAPRDRRNWFGETPQELQERLEREVWG